MRWPILLVVLLMLAAGVGAQDVSALSEADRALLQQANDTLNTSSYRFDVQAAFTLPDGTLQTSGGGAVQAASSGFLTLGRRARGFEIDLGGTLDVLGTQSDFDVGAVGLDGALYVDGLSAEGGWVQLPVNTAIPAAPLGGDFVTVQRAANVDGHPAFTFTYDLTDPALQRAVAAATSNLPDYGGAIATGESTAALLDDADLTMVQVIDADTQTVRAIAIDFRLGESHLQIDLTLRGYGQNVTVNAPAEAQPIAP